MAGNKNLNDAIKAKKDEFYTQLSDIEKEIILTSMDEGFTEEQMMELFMANIDDMENLRRAYRLSA